MAKTAIAVQENRVGEPDQLELRFFGILDGFTRRPPERALWRVLIDTALAKTDIFVARGRRISAEAVHHVALAFYMQADAAGVIHEFSEEFIAEQCRMSKRNVHAARQVLNDLRVVRSMPARGRRPGVHRMNLGGLDWPAVRQRVARTRRGDMVSPQSGPGEDRRGDMVSPQSGHEEDRRGDMVSPQDGRRGDMVSPQSDPGEDRRGDTMSPQDGRRGDMVSPPMGCTTELPLTAVADRYPSRARDREQQQQRFTERKAQRQEERIEGLIGAIAARARRLGMEYNEAEERHLLEAGEIGVDDLQRHADKLEEKLRSRRR